jgi:hypothetical protein
LDRLELRDPSAVADLRPVAPRLDAAAVSLAALVSAVGWHNEVVSPSGPALACAPADAAAPVLAVTGVATANCVMALATASATEKSRVAPSVRFAAAGAI